jgi:hypothetical protein
MAEENSAQPSEVFQDVDEFVPPPGSEPVANEPDPELTSQLEEAQAEIARLTERTQIVDQFERDPEGVMRDVLNRMGYDMSPRGQAQTQNTTSNVQPPQEFVESIRSNLSPDVQFMAEDLARASWIATQGAIQPLQQQQDSARQQQVDRERQEILAELGSTHPGWETAKSDMEGLYAFLQQAVNGGPLRHPKYGTVHEMMYKLATGEQRAATDAARRMATVARNRTNESNTTPSQPSVEQMISQAKSGADKWKIAFDAAMREHAS